MPFKKSKNRKKKDAAKEKSDSEDIDFDCEVSYSPPPPPPPPEFLPFLIQVFSDFFEIFIPAPWVIRWRTCLVL
jgi:hypothetical protein